MDTRSFLRTLNLTSDEGAACALAYIEKGHDAAKQRLADIAKAEERGPLRDEVDREAMFLRNHLKGSKW